MVNVKCELDIPSIGMARELYRDDSKGIVVSLHGTGDILLFNDGEQNPWQLLKLKVEPNDDEYLNDLEKEAERLKKEIFGSEDKSKEHSEYWEKPKD